MTTTRAATPRPQRRSVYAALAALLALTALVTGLLVLTHTDVAHARGCRGEDATRAMLAMYNAGEAAVRGCAAPANGETDRYVNRVLALQ